MPNWRYFCCFYVITFTWRLFMILLCPWCHFRSVANCAELLFLVGSSSLATEDIAAIFMSLYSSSPSRLLLSLRLPLIYWSLFSPQRRPQPPTFVLLATLMISSSHPSFGLVPPLLPLHLITMIWVDFWHSSWYTGLRGELKVLLPLQLVFFFEVYNNHMVSRSLSGIWMGRVHQRLERTCKFGWRFSVFPLPVYLTLLQE